MQSTKHFLKEQFRKLSALRNAPADEFAVKAITEQWERIVSMVGDQRFAQGIQNCVRYMSFFPSIDELEQKIPSGESTAERCPKCRNSEGFEYCEITRPDGSVTNGVRKCQHGAA